MFRKSSATGNCWWTGLAHRTPATDVRVDLNDRAFACEASGVPPRVIDIGRPSALCTAEAPIPEMLAMAAAFCAALSSMFISELKGRLPLFQLARWQMLAAFLLTGLVSLLVGGWRSVGPWQAGFLAASSFFGICIASTTYFAAIYAVGPRITALLFSMTAPFALALGYLALGETITRYQALGVVLVLCGVALAIGAPRRFLKQRRSAAPLGVMPPATVAVAVTQKPALTGPLLPGVALGLVTAFGQALGSLLARPAMASGVEPFTAMAVRSGIAAVFFVAVAVLPIARSRSATADRAALAICVASAFIGTGFGMSFLMAALHDGDVGIVTTLSSTTPVLILPMVWIWTGERPSMTAWIGALLAIFGIGLISWR
ncbi:MAG: DMT family transporter [Parvibaculaceae bacterium]